MLSNFLRHGISKVQIAKHFEVPSNTTHASVCELSDKKADLKMDPQSNENRTAAEPLHLVSKEDAKRLLKSLKDHGSEAITLYSAVWITLEWWKKNKDYRCTILTLEGGEDAGVCILILDEYDCKRVLFYSPEDEMASFTSALKATKLIPWDSIEIVAGLTKRLKDPVLDILKGKGYKSCIDGTLNYVMWMSPEDGLALKEKEPPENIRIRELTEDDTATLVEKWKFCRRDAVPLTRDCIRYNGGLGVEDKDGKLVAWILWIIFGSVAQLFVQPSHRRLGLGRLLAIRMTKIIAKKGLTVTAEIENPNEASLKIFRDIGFKNDHMNIYIGLNNYMNGF